jgi:glutathione S-transferase
MTLTLHYHPLASFCHKALVALYELDLPFAPVIVDFGDPASAEAFRKISPMAKMPVLVDGARVVAESSLVIEHANRIAGGSLIPADADLALSVRFWDRFFDHYLQFPMQKIVLDNLRAEADRDPFGVAQATSEIMQAYDHLEGALADGWLPGPGFSMADCAAVPALFYATTVVPLDGRYPRIEAYYARLSVRPSVIRTLREAEPYFSNFPHPAKLQLPVTAAS